MSAGPAFANQVATANAVDGLLSVTNAEGIPLVKSRVGTVQEALSCYRNMVQSAQGDRLNRLKIEWKLYGNPPYPPAELAKRGLADIANVNFGWLWDALEMALAPYYDLIDASETLARTPVVFGSDPEQRMDWQNIIEIELTRLITQGEGFSYDFGVLCHQFILHGIGVPYFTNKLDFEWTVGSIADFLIPRHTRAKASAVEVACIERFYLAHELFEQIQNVEAATAEGWNCKETWKIILNGRTDAANYYNAPERLEDDLKNNDYFWQGRSKEIRIVHMYVKALDGSVSHLMFDADGLCTDFLYKGIGQFKHQGEAFQIFTYGVGQNEFYHGIRGLGYKLFAIVKEMDELWSAYLDALRMAGKMVLKPQTEAALRKLALVQFGHFIVMPPNTDFQPFQFPNLSQSMMPGLNIFSSMLQQKSAQYTAPDQFQTKQSGRLKQLAARMEEVAHLSISKMNCFYATWERLLREQITRIIRRDWSKSDPGYDRVQEFYQRCKDQGVPREAIHTLDMKAMEAVRPIGAGSKAQRKAIMEDLERPLAEADEEGRYQFNRDRVRTIAGTEAVRRYFPPKPGMRPPLDETIADMENELMQLGGTPVFKINQMHAVHANQHLNFIGQLIQQSHQMLEQGIEDIRAFQSAPILKLAYDHTKEHIDEIPEKMPDDTNNAQRAELNKAYQEAGEAVNNNVKHYQKLTAQQQEQQQQGEQQGQAGGQPPQVDQASIAADQKAELAIANEQKRFQTQTFEEEKHQAQLRRSEESHKQKLRHKQEEMAAAMAAKDATTAADVASKLNKQV
jgi:hypothetical protein